ncbi:VTT domain-containing protein [Chloroflexota bacterium]
MAEDKMEKQGWLKRNITPLLTLLLVIAITSAILFFYRNFPDRFAELGSYGYFGAFLISLILNATIILPAGNFVVLFTLGGILPLPLAVGLAGGAGAAIGEMTGYAAGYSGRAMVARQEKVYARLEHQVKRWGALTIFFLSLLPLAFDLVGIAAGALRFPVWKFLLFCWLGRTILYISIALFGAWGLETILAYLG